MNEFDLINQYFNWDNSNLNALGVGDDCSLIELESCQLANTVDTLISGVHFPEDTPAEAIAYKALAVNLSDLAAMGATPLYFSLALTLPEIDKPWLESFSASLKALAQQYNIALIGGDTTRGHLSITINAAGIVPKNQALLRSGAQAGDIIYVSNTLGDAALAWKKIQQNQTPSEALLKQFNTPQPQVELGGALLGLASSCIDISDGLVQDLSHILKQSGVGAKLNLEDIPLGGEVSAYIRAEQDWCVAIAGGDDYELCFTINPSKVKTLEAVKKKLDIILSPIGVITQDLGIETVPALNKACQSYQHF